MMRTTQKGGEDCWVDGVDWGALEVAMVAKGSTQGWETIHRRDPQEEFFVPLEQTWAKCGPRATYGPRAAPV